MSLGIQETWRGLFDLLQDALQKGITTQEEEMVSATTLRWLSQHSVETFQHYERDRPVPAVCFRYGPDSAYATQITVYVSYNKEPVTLIVGIPPSNNATETRPVNSTADPGEHHECGFCGLTFGTIMELYGHQSRAHDSEGLMFSELGLPK